MIGSRSIYVRPASPVYVPPPRVQPRCDLPPLRAETASGSYITFNRRFKPSPPSLTVSSRVRGESDANAQLTFRTSLSEVEVLHRPCSVSRFIDS